MKKESPVIRSDQDYTLGDFPGDQESPNPANPSKTIPGMAVPLTTLLERFVKGREIPLQREPIYEGHLNLPDLRTMDKVEKAMYKKKVVAAISEFQQSSEAAKQKKSLDYIEGLKSQISALEQQQQESSDEGGLSEATSK